MSSPDSPILMQLGPIVIHWYGALVVCAILIGVIVARSEAKQRHENPNHVWDLLMWCLILGIMGARLYHILSSPVGASRDFNYYFIEQPFAIITMFGIPIAFPTALFIWEGGIGIFGALLGGIVGVMIYTHRQRLNLSRWLDIVAPATLLAQAIGRWGNFFNQELYGPPTNLPWGITITNVNQRLSPYNDLTSYPLDTTFHPVFLYESFWSLLGFVLLLWISRKYRSFLREGDIFALYLVWYPSGRLLLESLRPDAWMVRGIPVAQIVSIIFIAVGLGLFYQHHRSSMNNPPNLSSPESNNFLERE